MGEKRAHLEQYLPRLSMKAVPKAHCDRFLLHISQLQLQDLNTVGHFRALGSSIMLSCVSVVLQSHSSEPARTILNTELTPFLGRRRQQQVKLHFHQSPA